MFTLIGQTGILCLLREGGPEERNLKEGHKGPTRAAPFTREVLVAPRLQTGL